MQLQCNNSIDPIPRIISDELISPVQTVNQILLRDCHDGAMLQRQEHRLHDRSLDFGNSLP